MSHRHTVDEECTQKMKWNGVQRTCTTAVIKENEKMAWVLLQNMASLGPSSILSENEELNPSQLIVDACTDSSEEGDEVSTQPSVPSLNDSSSDNASSSVLLGEGLERWELKEPIILGASDKGRAIGNDDEKSRVGKTNDCAGSGIAATERLDSFATPPSDLESELSCDSAS